MEAKKSPPVVKPEGEVVNLGLIRGSCSKREERHNNLKEVSHPGK